MLNDKINMFPKDPHQYSRIFTNDSLLRRLPDLTKQDSYSITDGWKKFRVLVTG